MERNRATISNFYLKTVALSFFLLILPNKRRDITLSVWKADIFHILFGSLGYFYQYVDVGKLISHLNTAVLTGDNS